MKYLCSLGSNLQPEKYVPLALEKLSTCFGQILLSRIIKTKPVELDSTNYFLNALFLFKCEKDPTEVKQLFNQIELFCGREREHPLAKFKDRQMDLDILTSGEAIDLTRELNIPYLQGLVGDLNQLLNRQQLAMEVMLEVFPLNLFGQLIGQRPTTINFDCSSS